jgi:hypothetical protein
MACVLPARRAALVSITPLRPYGGNPDESFLAQFDNAGRKLQYSTYLMRSSGQLAFHSVTGVVYAVVSFRPLAVPTTVGTKIKQYQLVSGVK